MTRRRPSGEGARPAPGQRLGAGGLWSAAGITFAGNLVARGLGFLFPVVVARATDETGFALVYFFVNTGWFVSELVLTGFPTALTRALADERPTAGSAWLTSALAGGVPLLALSLVAGAALAHAAGEPPLLMTLVVVGLTIDAYYFALLRGLGEFALLAAYRVTANLFQIVLLVVFVWAGIDSPGAMVALYSFVYVVPIAFIEPARGHLVRTLRGAPRPSRAQIEALTRFALPALVSGTAYAAILGLDVFFVRVLAADALADYGAARTLALPMTFFPYAVAIVLLPHVAAASPRRQWSLLGRALGTSAALSVVAAAGYAAVGDLVLGVAFPPSYRGAAGALDVLVAACGLMGTYSVLSQWWLGRGRPLLPAASLTLGAVVAGAAHAVLTASYGAVGAGVSIGVGTSTAFLVLGVATIRLWAQERKVPLVASEPAT